MDTAALVAVSHGGDALHRYLWVTGISAPLSRPLPFPEGGNTLKASGEEQRAEDGEQDPQDKEKA